MTTEKRETAITNAFFARFQEMFPIREFFVMTHQDVRKPGYPDKSVHGHGRSTYWEFKHATPNFSTYRLQEVTCCRLARLSYCRYVLFYEHRGLLKTLIAHPQHVFRHDGKIERIKIETSISSHDFDALAWAIYNVHTTKR